VESVRDPITSIAEASVNARQVDHAFFAVFAIAGAILALLVVLFAVFLIRYRQGSPAYRGPLPKALRREIEIGWTVATTFLALFIFWWFVGGSGLPPRADPNQLEIHVVAKQWMWKTEHPDGAREIDALHLPMGRPVRLIMTSEDVIHSFFVPAFRLKQDVLPGRDTELAFTPTELGDFHLFCAEYCGTQHSHMGGDIVVMTPSDYAVWTKGQPHADTLAATGEALYAKLGCGTCHSDDSQIGAPKLAGLAGRKVMLEGGRSVIADDTYIRRSILQPRAETVAGYKPIMPSYAATASTEDIDALIAYIKSLPSQGAPP
jgi:cytochrome c oxidase subunit II